MREGSSGLVVLGKLALRRDISTRRVCGPSDWEGSIFDGEASAIE